jgi:hypothetical protein
MTETTKPSVNIPSVLASIQTRYLPNTSQIYYHRQNPPVKSKFFYTQYEQRYVFFIWVVICILNHRFWILFIALTLAVLAVVNYNLFSPVLDIILFLLQIPMSAQQNKCKGCLWQLYHTAPKYQEDRSTIYTTTPELHMVSAGSCWKVRFLSYIWVSQIYIKVRDIILYLENFYLTFIASVNLMN